MSDDETLREDRPPLAPLVDELDAAVTRAALRERMFGVADGGIRLGEFRLIRRLGAGASGDVSEAVHEALGSRVAIKRLVYADPELRVRLKREFRTLAEIAHPNLVQLYELFDSDGQTYFTMELVSGRPLDVALCSIARPHRFETIRNAFAQLAAGLAHVHRSGFLHLDVKPSNVLRCDDGRVVLLDFGLARTHSAHPLHESAIVREGTPLYMAPEQIDAGRVGPAADWYAFGTMLYEVLCERLPFPADTATSLRRAKRGGRPIAVSAIDAEVPRSLGDLALALLSPDPAHRPDAYAVLACLGADARPSAPSEVGLFVGRDAELALLQDALDEARTEGRPLTELVGASGMGKSALLRRFAVEAKTRHGAVVLAGRCHELESVPFRGLDGVIDELSSVLARMTETRVAELLPRDVGPLTAVFPVLERVRAIATAPRPRLGTVDAAEQRRRAFAALREILARLADRQPVVVLLDDWQWADRDALELVHVLLAPPDTPPVQFVLAAREGHELSPDLAQHCGRRLLVGPLPAGAARDLARRVVGIGAEASRRLEDILREADGCPLFLVELSQSLGDTGLTLAKHVEQRLATLSDSGRAIVQVLAIAGRPLPMDLAFHAANVARDCEPAVLAELRRARLVSTASTDRDRLEPVHDRIREIVAACCPSAHATDLHLGLAIGWAQGPTVDHAAAAYHFYAAGDRVRAARHAEEAANRAAAGLAFDQAARWYRAALEWSDHPCDHEAALLGRLADVLADAGHGADAADAFIAAAGLASPSVGFELRRRAAGQLLRCGHVDRGRSLLRDVLGEAGLDVPTRPLARMLIERLRQWPRTRRTRRRDASEIPPRVLSRIDACWTAATGLGFIDIATAAAFFAQGTRLALQAGEPMRVSRWLSLQAIQESLPGGTARRRAEIARARARDALHDDPTSRGLLRWAEGQGAHSVGEWRAALSACDEAIDLLEREARGAWWEITSAQIIGESALYWLGDLPQLRVRVEDRVASAQMRGDLFAVVTRRAGGLSAIGRLAADDPDRAAAELDEALTRWTRVGVHVQHWYAMQARVQIDLYCGEAARLWRRLEQDWPMLERSHLHRVQPMRVTSHWRRGAAAVAASVEDSAAIDIARTQVDRLKREAMRWSDVLAALLAAAVAHRRGHDEEAAHHLHEATKAGTKAEMELLVAIASRRLGQLLGGDEGAAGIEHADAWLRVRGVQRPERFCDALLPFPGPR
jgi:hypothetical protein